MFERTRSSFAWLAIAAVVTGCTQAMPDEDETVAEVSQAEVEANNILLNGVHLNGNEYNGVYFNGVVMNGVYLNGVYFNGVHLNGSEFKGTPENESMEFGGIALVDAKMDGLLSDNTVLQLGVYDVEYTDSKYYYAVRYTTDGGSTWQSLCGDSGGSPVKALFLGGRWDNDSGAKVSDSTMFTVACKGSALCKCTEWGYRPWDSDIVEWDSGNVNHHNVPVADLHQACTRMVRADYCGDGTPHTVAGTSINIWDNFKIQDRDTSSTMPLEAEWSPDGAVCVKHTRWSQSSTNPDYDYIMSNCSSRWAGPTSGTCGNDTYSTFVVANGYSTSLGSRALLRNESDNNIYAP